MMTDFLIAYWLHSTVLLALVWCVMKIARPGSSVACERLWKLAAVLPVLTAATSVGFRSAKAVPFAERTATIVEWPTASVPSAGGGSGRVQHRPLPDPPSADGTANQHRDDRVEVNDLVAAEVIEIEQDVIDPVAPKSGVDSGSTVELVDQSFEPVVRIENPGDELPREARVELGESHQRPQVDGVSISQASAATIHPEAWQSVWNLLSPALSACVTVAVLWLLVRSLWFRSRLRKARRLDRGRAVELLRDLNVAVTLRVTSRTSSDSETETASDFGWRRYVSRVLRSARLVTRRVTATLADSSPRVRLLIVPGFCEPAAFGIWRPTIVLPPSCEALPREELRAVLAHELGHIVRGDVWWLLIGRVLTTVFGFQPLNRIARREWTAAAECLCDSWAVDRGVERLTLARCLTALAENRLTGVSLADALAAVGSPSSLRTRIERLVGEPVVDPWAKRSRRWLLSGSVIAAAALAAVTLPLPKVVTASIPSAFGGSGSGLHEDHARNEPLSDGRGMELIREIETELAALRTELNRAEQQSDPQWLDAVEQLRDRERRLVERWRVLRNESGKVQEPGTLIDAGGPGWNNLGAQHKKLGVGVEPTSSQLIE